MLIKGTDALPVSNPAGRGWKRRRWLPALVIALLGLVPIASAAAWLQAPTDASPATGGAQVIAHGVLQIPDGDLVWQIERQTAPPPAAAEPIAATTGFLLGSAGAVLVEDAPEGEQTRLAPGEAVLTQAGTEQVRAAIGPTAATYFAISLVAPGTAASATGELVFASEPFVGLNGRHDVDLVRDVLGAAESTELPAGAGPTLMFVTAGAADVALASGEVVTRAVDQAIALAGPLVVTAGADGAVVQAVVIGPAVPRLAGPAAAATTPPASPVAASPAAVATVPSGTPAPVTTDEAAEPATDEAAVTDEAATTDEGAAVDETPLDSDGDGLVDGDEAGLNTDPAVVDTDGDGLTDGDEVLVYGTAPLAPDSDGDGILDGDEINQGTDPLAGDAELDPAPDPAPDPGVGGDSDGDGLDDGFEAELGTDGLDPDTDDDGLTDGDEYFTFQTGTLNPDTDADGVLDGVEIENGTDPNDPNSL